MKLLKTFICDVLQNFQQISRKSSVKSPGIGGDVLITVLYRFFFQNREGILLLKLEESNFTTARLSELFGRVGVHVSFID